MWTAETGMFVCASAVLTVFAAVYTVDGGGIGRTETVVAAVQTQKHLTDAHTRDGMEAIRRRVIDVHTLITHRRMPVALARQFADAVIMQADTIARARSDKQPKPDVLEPLLQKIRSGASAVAGRTPEVAQIDGLIGIVGALEDYAVTFDHPGWKGLQEQ